jgi:hypothetical protein
LFRFRTRERDFSIVIFSYGRTLKVETSRKRAMYQGAGRVVSGKVRWYGMG